MVLAFSMLLAAQVPLAAAYSVGNYGNAVSDEVRDANYLLGALTWQAGKGGIALGSDAQFEDPAGPLKDASADQAQYLSYQTRQRVGTAPAPVEFLSDALPQTLYLNASRLIQLDLFIVQPGDTSGPNTVPCTTGGYSSSANAAAPDVQLSIGTTLVAGAPYSSYMFMWPYGGNPWYNHYPANPPGYSVCRYRMPTEVSVLPAGSVLKLLVTPTLDAYRHYQYGVAGDHRSVLRLPYYPEEEVFYRYPELSSSPAQPTTGGDGSSTPNTLFGPAGAGGWVALAGMAAVVGRRRGSASVRVAACLLLVGFSGCLTSGSDADLDASNSAEPTGGATSTIQPLAGDSDLARTALGAVWGLVHDDLNLPLARAHVSLIGTANYTESDAGGRFKLNNIAPGAYTLRVDRPDYRSLETPVRVVANNITRVDVTLVPIQVREGDARAHHHDYWGGATTVTAFEDSLGQTCAATGGSCYPVSTFSLQAAKSGSVPNTIRPGTSDVEVTVTWDKTQMAIDRVGLVVYSNYPRPWNVNNNQNASYYYPRESPATFHVATNWEMADVGHQPFSTWSFGLYAVSRDQHNSIYDPQYYTGLAKQYTSASAPQFTAKVVLHKGTVPLERAHPDYYGAGQSLVVAKGTKAGPSSATVLVTDAIFGLGFVAYCAAQTWLNYAWTPTLVVPQGTTWVEVVVKQNRETGVAGVGHYDWVLWYKPANVPAKTFLFPTADQPTSNPSYKPAGAFQARESNTNYTWRFPIKTEEPDSFYNVKSNWMFAMHPTDFKAACIDTRTYVYTNPLAASVLTVSWTVTAHRDPMPT